MKFKKLAWTVMALTVATTTLYAAPAGNVPGFKPVNQTTVQEQGDQATMLIHSMMPRGAEYIETNAIEIEDKAYYEVFFSFKTMRIAGLVDAKSGELTKIVAEDTAFVAPKVKNLFYKNPKYKPAVKLKEAEKKAMSLLAESKLTQKTQLGEHKSLWAYCVEVANTEMTLQVLLDTETNAVKTVYAYPKAKETTPETGKPDAGGILSKQQIIAMLQAKYKNLKVIEIELDKDDNRYEYEVEAVDGKFEYEFEIDAKTGKILDMDKEKIDYDDHDDEWDD
ncbi:MAG: PepSY domain-containing protein [Cellulosilyticaceae bacterium]